MKKIISLTSLTLNSMESYDKANNFLKNGWILLETNKNFTLLFGATIETKMDDCLDQGVRYVQ